MATNKLRQMNADSYLNEIFSIHQRGRLRLNDNTCNICLGLSAFKYKWQHLPKFVDVKLFCRLDLRSRTHGGGQRGQEPGLQGQIKRGTYTQSKVSYRSQTINVNEIQSLGVNKPIDFCALICYSLRSDGILLLLR